MTQPDAYSVYLTAATVEHPIGYVIDRVLWDGRSDWSPPDGTAAIPDHEGQHPIGSSYTAPSA
ncbi:hypothetical protein C0V97_12425 [Asaia sp. W19]|nr:hypothetical protein C0V97_12425 [Asaia sp. W19]